MAGKGGSRPGAGRPKGSRDRIYPRDGVYPRGQKRRRAERAQEAALQYLRTTDRAIFDGDGVALMIAVYRDETMPLTLRVQCAALAAPYERPRLNATAVVTKNADAGANPNFGKLFSELEARLALHPPQKRLELIEALRNGEDEPRSEDSPKPPRGQV